MEGNLKRADWLSVVDDQRQIAVVNSYSEKADRVTCIYLFKTFIFISLQNGNAS